MDSRTGRKKSREGFKNTVNIWNRTDCNIADNVICEGTFPVFINSQRRFPHPYSLRHRNAVNPEKPNTSVCELSTDLKNIVCGICPWRPSGKCYDSRPIIELHEEINDFYNYMSPTPEEHAARRAIVCNIEAVVHELWPFARVQVFGSFCTGLYLPTSDINLLVIGNWSRFPLSTLGDALTKEGVCNESSICVVKRSPGPSLKLSDNLFGFKIGIFFNDCSLPQSSELIKEYKAKFPALGKLSLVLKHFLYQRDLNESFFGGVSYHGLLMMIVSFLQLHPRPDANTSHANLGVLLMEFFEHYGRKFNYSVVAIRTRKRGSYVPKNKLGLHLRSIHHSSMLCIEDPLNSSDDLGYGTSRALQVRQAFMLAYVTLNQVMNDVCDDNFQPNESILGRIVRVSDSVVSQRLSIKNKFSVMSAIKSNILS